MDTSIGTHNQPAPGVRECAQLLIETIPNLMRGMRSAAQQCKSGEDEQLSMGQFRMLEILSAAPRTLSELAALHHVTPSTMSRMVDVLVRNAWVKREPSPHDRRQVILTLTPEGQATRSARGQHMQEAFIAMLTQLLAQLGDSERARLYDGMLVLRKLVERPEDRGIGDGR